MQPTGPFAPAPKASAPRAGADTERPTRSRSVSAMAENPAIAVEDLAKTFPKGRVRALDGVSFETAPGTVLGLLGPNGAGKTTAVRILSTVLLPDRGRASILGLDVV